MRKLILYTFLLIPLSGCVMFDSMKQDPMALLSPTAQYILMTDQSNKHSNKSEAISVESMLSMTISEKMKDAESIEDGMQMIFPLMIAYDDFIERNYAATLLENLATHKIILACGPFGLGDPITAASNALRACSDIQRLFRDHDITFRAEFSPKDKADHVTIKLQSSKADSNA